MSVNNTNYVNFDGTVFLVLAGICATLAVGGSYRKWSKGSIDVLGSVAIGSIALAVLLPRNRSVVPVPGRLLNKHRGDHCFILSALQCIFNIPALKNAFAQSTICNTMEGGAQGLITRCDNGTWSIEDTQELRECLNGLDNQIPQRGPGASDVVLQVILNNIDPNKELCGLVVKDCNGYLFQDLNPTERDGLKQNRYEEKEKDFFFKERPAPVVPVVEINLPATANVNQWLSEPREETVDAGLSYQGSNESQTLTIRKESIKKKIAYCKYEHTHKDNQGVFLRFHATNFGARRQGDRNFIFSQGFLLNLTGDQSHTITSFVVCKGNHFVQYQRMADDQWKLNNDSRTRLIDDEEALRWIPKAYYVYAHKE